MTERFNGEKALAEWEHTNDIVTRLRDRDQKAKIEGGDMLYYGKGDLLAREAADEIERLRAALSTPEGTPK